MTGLEKYREADLLSDNRLDLCQHLLLLFFYCFLKRDIKGCYCVHLAAEVDKGDELLGVRLPPVDHEHHVGGENKGHAVSTASNEKKKKNYSLLYSREEFLSVSSHSKHVTRQCCGSGFIESGSGSSILS
jgi:hypothetical protein